MQNWQSRALSHSQSWQRRATSTHGRESAVIPSPWEHGHRKGQPGQPVWMAYAHIEPPSTRAPRTATQSEGKQTHPCLPAKTRPRPPERQPECGEPGPASGTETPVRPREPSQSSTVLEQGHAAWDFGSTKVPKDKHRALREAPAHSASALTCAYAPRRAAYSTAAYGGRPIWPVTPMALLTHPTMVGCSQGPSTRTHHALERLEPAHARAPWPAAGSNAQGTWCRNFAQRG